MKNMRLGVLILAIFLSACASEPLITDMDVLTHQNNGELLNFYSRLNSELKLAKPTSDLAENRRIYIAKVGEKIAEEKEQVVLDGLDREFGKHSIATLQSALEKTLDIKSYSERIYTDLRMQFEQAITQKKGVILSKEAEYYELTDKDALRKVQLLDEITAIYGPGQDADQVGMQRNAYIQGLFQNAQKLMVSKRYEDVVQLLNSIEKIDPEFDGIDEMKGQLLAADYEQQFWDALGKGQTDRAYETFHRLTQIPDYVSAHPDVIPTADDMAQYFIAEGDQAMSDKSLDMAYVAYSRARYIRTVIGNADIYSPGEKKFIDLMDKRFSDYLSKSMAVPAMGTLAIIEELMPTHPSLQYAKKINEDILAEASIKIITAGFTGNNPEHDFAGMITGKIITQLKEALPSQLQIIDSALAATDYAPSQIISRPNPVSFYILSGEVLEASLAKKEKKTSTTMNVLTGVIKEPNPAYNEWLSLSKRKQAQIPQPAVTIDKPVEEDVVIEKTVTEQNAVLSVAYRLANAVSASVIFSDSPSEKGQFIAENIKGVEAGTFVQPEKVEAILPATEIWEKLSSSLAVDAATKIAAQVTSLQESYIKNGNQYVVSEDFNKALENYAYAYSLSTLDEGSDTDALKKLRIYSLRWQ